MIDWLRHRSVIAILGLGCCSGCGDTASTSRDTPVPTAAPLADAKASSETGSVLTAPTEKQFEGIRLTIPAGWEEKPVASEFIQAEYQVTGTAGAARMTLSSAGGGVEANLERWQGQFQPGPNDASPERSTVTVDGVEATIIELHGTFTDGFRGGEPHASWAMLGAIIPTGPANFFLKLTGPQATISEHRDEFRAMVTSAQLSK